MEQLHEKLLEVMDVFHAFCKEQGLTYYMLGGTMLGAYRHRGFIPWDDDIDIGMPRVDYEKLLALRNSMPSGYGIRHHRFESGIPYAFAHFEDVNTTYIEQRRSKDTYVGGVYLEIFPLDTAPAGRLARLVKSYQVRFYKRILYGLILDYNQKKRTFPKSLIIKTIRLLFDMDKTTKRLDNCIRKEEGNSGIYSNLLGHWGIKEDISKEVFGEPRKFQFENRMLYGAAEPEQYLSSLYGKDYMIPPTEEEKEAGKHPAAYMDLELPYRLYKKESR